MSLLAYVGEALLHAQFKQIYQTSLLAYVGAPVLHADVGHICLSHLMLAAGASGGFWGPPGGLLGLSGLPFEGLYLPIWVKSSVY